MNRPANLSQSPERLFAQAVAALVPFLIDGTQFEEATGRLAAKTLLEDYDTRTPKELQLATQIVALSWASLACLRAAMAVKNRSIDEMLALQDSAIALDRSCQKSTRALAARQKERAKNPKTLSTENWKWDEGVFQLTINQALEKLMDANEKLAAYMDRIMPPVVKKPKMPILFAERMTPSVLSRRTRG